MKMGLEKIKRGCLKSRIDCHIELAEILAINLIAFGKLRLTILLRQPLGRTVNIIMQSRFYLLRFCQEI